MPYTKVRQEKGWLDRLNQNDSDNNIIDSGWDTTGIVYTNGFENTPSNPLQYRIVKFGASGLTLLMISGYFVLTSKTGAIKAGTVVNIATMPKTVFELSNNSVGHVKSIIGREFLNNNAGVLEIGLSATGQLSINTRADEGINSTFFIDTIFVVNAV